MIPNVRLGGELGHGSEGVIYELPDEPGWAIKEYYPNATSPFQAANEFANLEMRVRSTLTMSCKLGCRSILGRAGS